MINIYTDGSFSHQNNTGGGIGVVVCDADGNTLQTLKRKYECTTANRMEMIAALIAVWLVTTKYEGQDAVIHTDCAFVMKVVKDARRGKFDRGMHIDLQIAVAKLLDKCEVTFVHIKRDSCEQNKVADLLANNARLYDQGGKVDLHSRNWLFNWDDAVEYGGDNADRIAQYCLRNGFRYNPD